MKKMLFSMCLILATSLSAQETIIPGNASYVVQTESSSDGEGTVEWVLGLNYWLPGETFISKNDIGIDKEGGVFVSAVIDYYVAKRFVTGLYANIGTYKLEEGDGGTYSEIGMILRPKLQLGGSVALKIGPAIGYRTISIEDQNFIGMAVNLDAELQFGASGDKFKKFVHIGFLAQPIGGSDDWEYDFPPLWFLGGGVAF